MDILVKFENPLRISQSKYSLESIIVMVNDPTMFVANNGIDKIKIGYKDEKILPKMLKDDGN
jgi:hypothetical protein